MESLQEAGRPTIPAIVMDLDEKQTLEISLIENLQRGFESIEEAREFRNW